MKVIGNNTVANIIKVYAILNAIVGVFCVMIMQVSGIFGWICIEGVLVVSTGIYATGEIIDILQDIKDHNTAIKTGNEKEELPFI